MEEKKRRPIEPIHSCDQCLKLIKAARAHISVIDKQMEIFRVAAFEHKDGLVLTREECERIWDHTALPAFRLRGFVSRTDGRKMKSMTQEEFDEYLNWGIDFDKRTCGSPVTRTGQEGERPVFQLIQGGKADAHPVNYREG